MRKMESFMAAVKNKIPNISFNKMYNMLLGNLNDWP